MRGPRGSSTSWRRGATSARSTARTPGRSCGGRGGPRAVPNPAGGSAGRGGTGERRRPRGGRGGGRMPRGDEARGTADGRADVGRPAVTAEPAPGLPQRLYTARERKGVDLYRAERDTKIRARY